MYFQPIKKLLIATALVAGSTVASATSVTYDFTGFVQANFFSGPPPFAVGTPVSGSFTFDYDAAIPGQGTGTVGSQTDLWSVSSNGVPAALVFSATVTFGGTTISTNPIGQYQN